MSVDTVNLIVLFTLPGDNYCSPPPNQTQSVFCTFDEHRAVNSCAACILQTTINGATWPSFHLNLLQIEIYIYIYKCVPWYHIQLLSQCIKQPVNQFSKTQRSITTPGYDELRWTSSSNKLSPISILQMSDVLSEAKCSSSVVAAFCVHSVESVVGDWGKEEFDIYRAGEG